jgi:hypothetical protein
MIAHSTIHGLPKVGSGSREYEDAASGPVTEGDVVRFAVADGATETAFSGEWARCLADHAARCRLAEGVERARASFADVVSARDHPEPWYLEAKVAEGAHATVLALEIRNGGSWSAEAVGDCSLIHLREGRMLRAWPIEDPAGFGHRPPLVSSSPETPIPEIESAEGEWAAGDVVLLTTDALAAYLLANDPNEAVGLDERGFSIFVERARGRGMRNDDVTLIEVGLR